MSESEQYASALLYSQWQQDSRSQQRKDDEQRPRRRIAAIRLIPLLSRIAFHLLIFHSHSFFILIMLLQRMVKPTLRLPTTRAGQRSP